jgi:N-dimethylarginine dimethylaminohydrolase
MKFGADNLFKKLRSVLVSSPENYGIGTPINMWQEKNVGAIDQKLAVKQHGDMVQALRNEGVDCYFLEKIKGATEQKDTRDLGVISKYGAIAGHFVKDIRLGEVASFIKFCVENDIKILKYGIPFEGGDFFFIDETQCLVGIGPRTDMRPNEVETFLKRKIYIVHHSSSHHLDAFFNIISPTLVVANTKYLAEKEFLQGKKVIELDDDDIWNMSSNFLLLEENKILADSGCHEFNEKLKNEGVEVIEVDVSELKKNGGSIRCMTLPIFRE